MERPVEHKRPQPTHLPPSAQPILPRASSPAAPTIPLQPAAKSRFTHAGVVAGNHRPDHLRQATWKHPPSHPQTLPLLSYLLIQSRDSSKALALQVGGQRGRCGTGVCVGASLHTLSAPLPPRIKGLFIVLVHPRSHGAWVFRMQVQMQWNPTDRYLRNREITKPRGPPNTRPNPCPNPSDRRDRDARFCGTTYPQV